MFHVALKWSPLPSTSVAIISYLVEKEICQPLLFQSADIDGYPNGVTPLEFVKHFEVSNRNKRKGLTYSSAVLWAVVTCSAPMYQ